jgi:hypothetical protein
VARAGSDQTITLPADSVTLNGSASSDSDGSIASYAWTQTSKPDGASDAVIGSPANVSTAVGGLTAKGKYTFQLKVTDNDAAESMDAVDVTVKAAPVIKTVNVSVGANPFTTSSTTVDFRPDFSFTGEGAAYFNASDITYTLSSTGDDPSEIKPEAELEIYGGVIPANIYADVDTPTFTQIFYYNGQEIGRRSVVFVCFVFGPSFAEFGFMYDDNVNWNEIDSIPAVNLQQISKQVTE